MKARHCVLSAIAAFVMGCGPAQPAEAPKPAAKKEAKVAAPDKPDLSPVAAPPELFGVARFAKPGVAIDTVSKWTGFPFDWRTLLAKEAPGLESVVAFDAPLDVAAMLDPASRMQPKIMFAVSIGVTSADAAAELFRERDEDVERLPKGAYRIRLGDRPVCLAMPSVGPSAARVVCSESDESVDALAPYMTRGLPNETLSQTDLHVRLSPAIFQARYGNQLTMLKTAGIPFVMREIALDHPRFDRALKDTLYAFADEIVDVAKELDQIAIDVTFAADREVVDASLSVRLAGERSWTSQALRGASGRMMKAPDLFWRLPGDVVSASYAVKGDPKHAQRVANPLADLLDGGLDYLEVPARRRTALVEAFQSMLTASDTAVYGQLVDDSGSQIATDAPKPEQVREAARRLVGNHLFGVAGDASAITSLLSELTQTVSGRALRRRLQDPKFFGDTPIPKVKKRRPRGTRGLPPNTQVYEITIPASAFAVSYSPKEGERKPKLKPLSIVVVSMPDGEQTWFGVSADEKKLYEHLKAARAGGDAATRLGSRAGLQALRDTPSATAGFNTLAAILGGIDSPLGGLDQPGALPTQQLAARRMLSSMPHHGTTPMLWSGRAATEGPTMSFEGQIPKAVVQDIAAAIASRAAGRLF